MQQRNPWSLLLGGALVAGTALAASCSSSNNDSSGGTQSSGTVNSTGTQGTGGSCGFGCGQGGGINGTLTISPPTATITVVDGVAQVAPFEADLNGQAVAGAAWVVDLSSVATVDATGNVTATGNVGGQVVLKATLNGQTATALVDVNIKKTLNLGGFTAGEQALLQGATSPDASVVWAYPYDKTVFPKGILAPELMWNGGGVGDKYFVHLVGHYVDLNIFTTADPASRFQLGDLEWTQLIESGPGGKVNLDVARLPTGAPDATKVASHTWTIANGSLRGTVYYWSNNLGRVLRIKPGDAMPEDFLAAAGVTGNCSTCHAVSANGSTLILGGDVGVSTFDLLTNTTALDIQNVGKPIRNWAMPAVSPDGNVVIENNAPLPGPPGGSDGMWDSHTGTKLTGTGLEGIFLDMPAFAPDGTRLAYVDHNTKGLGIFNYDAVAHTAANAIPLVAQGASPIAFPSVSPDAKSIAYHRGSLDTRFGPGDLYLASVDQPGSETPLAGINGDTYPFAAGARDLHQNYEPTFAPLDAGGFAWVVFTSRRTYGNRLTGDSTVVKQLWVAAIDQTVTPGVDPSHPAFHVPGQDQGTLNMRGFWALDTCKQTGATCGTGSECCNKNCDAGVCKDPNPNGCSALGNECKGTPDCCDAPATCINGFCSEPPPN